MASLKARFGGNARAETLSGAEGIETPGLALWPDDRARRLEVFFDEDGKGPVSFVRLGDKAEWRVAGLGLGDSIARVREANGKYFIFSGFEWDYGGYVTDLSGGQLTALPGGCTLSLRFEVPEGIVIRYGLLGEVDLSSDDPAVEASHARLSELGVGFPTAEPGE